ncbi:MAG: hypothetical protein AAGJ87_16110 [Pseudomonadota bacterium]
MAVRVRLLGLAAFVGEVVVGGGRKGIADGPDSRFEGRGSEARTSAPKLALGLSLDPGEGTAAAHAAGFVSGYRAAEAAAAAEAIIDGWAEFDSLTPFWRA